ncbi:MAG: hypothetical protein EAZ62_04355, partial [Sphingobacteriia bacterium]
MRNFLLLALLCVAVAVQAQKKPLDHSVYDGWQTVAERVLSANGQFMAFTVNPQEGDGVLYVKKTSGETIQTIERGYGVEISDDSRFLVCRIRPLYKATREARIQKKRPDDMPKDSLAILDLTSGKLEKIPRIKSFKWADENRQFLVYHLEKALPTAARPRTEPDSLARITAMVSRADSLVKLADSLRNKAAEAQAKGLSVLQINNRPVAAPRSPEEPVEEGTELVILDLKTGKKFSIPLVSEYVFNKKGTVLAIETTRKNGDPKSAATVWVCALSTAKPQAILQGFQDAKNYRWDEAGQQLAFVADRDSSTKALSKNFKLYYWKGSDSAQAVVENKTNGTSKWAAITEFSAPSFSASGERFFVGLGQLYPPKDTSLPDFDRVNVDVWHYKEDYLQTAQIKNADQELRRTALARVDLNGGRVLPLGTPDFRQLILTQEGDGEMFYGLNDAGKRVESQWQGYTLYDLYWINPKTGERGLITKDFKGSLSASTTGQFLLQYDEPKKQYRNFDARSRQSVVLAQDIKYPLYDIETDVPDDPNAYGVMAWTEKDEAVLVYDQFDIWQLDPAGKKPAICLTNGKGRQNSLVFRQVVLDREERFIKPGQTLLLSVFNQKDKGSGAVTQVYGKPFVWKENTALTQPLRMANFAKAKLAPVLAFSTETYQRSANVQVLDNMDAVQEKAQSATVLFQPNAQQAQYNWGSAELFKWKAYTGKETEGIVYKPEGFDPKKKYPMIVYFYERSNNTLHGYRAPSPTASALNIPFFVSRGYVVFVPDIWYKTGYPGQSAYDYIVSGTRAVVKQGYVDSTKMGLQGQSWGGYQIVYLITKTNLYAAAWAGAPVA